MKYFNGAICELILIITQDVQSQKIKFHDENLKSALIDIEYDYSKKEK